MASGATAAHTDGQSLDARDIQSSPGKAAAAAGPTGSVEATSTAATAAAPGLGGNSCHAIGYRPRCAIRQLVEYHFLLIPYRNGPLGKVIIRRADAAGTVRLTGIIKYAVDEASFTARARSVAEPPPAARGTFGPRVPPVSFTGSTDEALMVRMDVTGHKQVAIMKASLLTGSLIAVPSRPAGSSIRPRYPTIVLARSAHET